ncbi:MAG: sigma factor-like helix-turn-helix DNA-binding protein, partial [Woeseiaceae bacterium]
NVCLRAARYLRQTGGRAPTIAELAAFLDRDVADVERLMGLHKRVTVRSGSRDDGAAGPVEQLQARRSAEPSRCAQADNVHAIVERWIYELNDKQRAVVERRFGLHGHWRATLEEIGRDIGVTRERVRQIQLGAQRRLRELLEREGISGDAVLD